MNKLVGQELLEMLDSLGDVSIKEKAIATGYFNVTEDGARKAVFSEFYAAFAEAKDSAKALSQAIEEPGQEEISPSDIRFWEDLDEERIEELVYYMDLTPPPAVIPRLAQARRPRIRESVATLIETPLEILESLSQDLESEVRDAAAISIVKNMIDRKMSNSELTDYLSSKQIDSDAADKIFRLGNSDLTISLSSNPFIDKETLRCWSETDLDDWLKDNILQNLAKRNLPDSFAKLDESAVIQKISEELPDEEILRNLILIYIDSYLTKGLCLFLAEHDKTPPNILCFLIEKGDSRIRRAVAQNHAATLDCLSQLVHDPEDYVRKEVAKNRNTTVELLELLSKDAVESVKAAASLRMLPEEWQNLNFDMLHEKLRTDVVTDEIFLMHISDGNSDILRSIAGNPCISEKIQRILSNDFDPTVIAELVLNPATSENILKRINKSWHQDTTVQSAISRRSLPHEIINLEEDELINQIREGKIDKSFLTGLFKVSNLVVRRAILECSLLTDTDKESIWAKYYEHIYPSGWNQEKLFTELHKKGWIIMAVSTYVSDGEGSLTATAKQDVIADAQKLIELASETKTCWSSSFLREGSQSCSGSFYVVDPYGDCLLSLINREQHADDSLCATLSCDLDDILSIAKSRGPGRVFSCVAFTYLEDEANIEIEDIQREISVDDGEFFVNFPSLSKQFEEGLEVYFKPHPSQGNSKVVTRLSWENGILEDEDELANKMSSQLKEVRVGNPFEILYV